MAHDEWHGMLLWQCQHGLRNVMTEWIAHLHYLLVCVPFLPKGDEVLQLPSAQLHWSGVYYRRNGAAVSVCLSALSLSLKCKYLTILESCDEKKRRLLLLR